MRAPSRRISRSGATKEDFSRLRSPRVWPRPGSRHCRLARRGYFIGVLAAIQRVRSVVTLDVYSKRRRKGLGLLKCDLSIANGFFLPLTPLHLPLQHRFRSKSLNNERVNENDFLVRGYSKRIKYDHRASDVGPGVNDPSSTRFSDVRIAAVTA